MIGEELEALSWKLGQTVDALCLLLDGLEREGMGVTQGPAAAENFAVRLRVYMGAFHLLTDTIEATANTLTEISERKEDKQHG